MTKYLVTHYIYSIVEADYPLEKWHGVADEVETCPEETDYPERTPYIQVEYDPTYFGGDYDQVGDHAYIPAPLIEQYGVAKAFTISANLSSAHIISFNDEDSYTFDGCGPFELGDDFLFDQDTFEHREKYH